MQMLYDVLLPGPWWHPLTYSGNGKDFPEKGCRVRVPIGRTERTGIVTGIREAKGEVCNKQQFSCRSILYAVDEAPAVTEEILQTLFLAGKHFLCGPGELLKSAFPSPFFDGKEAPNAPLMSPEKTRASYSIAFVRDAKDSDRFRSYLEILEKDDHGGFVIFPERNRAALFWKDLPDKLKERAILWPAGNGKRAWESWIKVLKGQQNIVIGSMGCLFAPLTCIRNVIVEDEGNPVYYSIRYPYIHARSVLTYRARYWKAKLVLGGAMPSSRSFLFRKEKCTARTGGRLIFADKSGAREFEVRGVKRPLPVTDAVLARTQEAVAEHGIVMWLLDRIGYASGIWCRECESILTCPKCGTALRWETRESTAVCPFCGNRGKLPEECPNCGGAFMEGIKPGIEASVDLASNLLGNKDLVHEWHKAVTKEKSSRNKMLKELEASGGIVTGTRKALELCDDIPVAVVCWLDIDTELLKPSYDVKYRAFRMIWESLWRGMEPENRKVILQTKATGTAWQKKLEKGWHQFWESELAERKELDLPPWKFLVEINTKSRIKNEMLSILESAGFECLDPDPSSGLFWVRTEKTETMRKAVEPFFSVSRSKEGFPRMRVCID